MEDESYEVEGGSVALRLSGNAPSQETIAHLSVWTITKIFKMNVS